MKLELKEYEAKMSKSLNLYEQEIQTVRAGRANAAVLNKVTVDYYGTPTLISQMAEIRSPDPRTLVIAPWDAATLKAIDHAIAASDLGLQPQNDGKVIRLVFPQPTQERRTELTKKVSKMGEECKISIRNIRREANDKAKEMKKKSEMTENEQKISEKEVQDLTDKYIKAIDAATAKKNKEIMEI